MRARTAIGAFEQAMREGDAEVALACAGEIPELSLDRALRLTLLLGVQRHPLYRAAARRFLVRFILECETRLIEIKRLADALAYIHHSRYGPQARRGLEALVGRLRRREAELSIDFDSLG